MRKAMFSELKSVSERFIAICVSRSKSLPELYIGGSHRETGEIRRTAASVHLVHRYTLTCLWNGWMYFSETCHSYSLPGPRDTDDILKVISSEVK